MLGSGRVHRVLAFRPPKSSALLQDCPCKLVSVASKGFHRLTGDSPRRLDVEVSLSDDVDAVPRWWHSIDLGEGVITPGSKSVADLEYEWSQMAPGDLSAKTVIDIGAWDGWMSFAAERGVQSASLPLTTTSGL